VASIVLKPRGLWTNPSGLTAPDGTLLVAENVVFDRPGTLSPRRGSALLAGTVSGTVNRMAYFGGYVVAHRSTSSISYSSDGSSWTTYSGSYAVPESGTRVRFWEASGSLFVTTSLGIYELDTPTGTWRLTGSPKALDAVATLRRTTSETGFAVANTQYAYRTVWGIRNTSGRLQLGEPSGRVLVTNPAPVVVPAAGITKAGSAVVTVDGVTHGLTTGEYIDVTFAGTHTDFVEGRFSVTVTDSNTFTYNDAGGTPTGAVASDGTYSFASRNVSFAQPVPSDITVSHFLQIYRSGASASASAEPGDQMGLVFERAPTNLEITAGSMTVVDIVDDGLRGADLYTNNGATAPKTRPPHALDAALFNGSTFYANIQRIHAVEFQLLAVGGSFGLASADTLAFHATTGIDTSAWAITLVAGAADNYAASTYKVYTTGSAAQNIADTAKSIVRCINGITANTQIRAEYTSGETEAPGRIRVYATTPAIGQFSPVVGISSVVPSLYFAPNLPLAPRCAAADIARAANVVTVTTTSGNHGFTTGQVIIMDALATADANFAVGSKTITVVDPNTFTYAEAGSDVTSTQDYAALSQSLSVVASSNDDYPNGLTWSLPNEPWAVPQTNLVRVGSERATIKRLSPLRDRLLVWTDEGLYQVAGNYGAFAVSELDKTVNLIAYDSVATLGGKAYALTNQGVVEVLEAARVISAQIDNKYIDLLALSSTMPAVVAQYAFAMGYESDRKYILSLPLTSGSTGCAHQYVWQSDSEQWSRWTYGEWSGPTVTTTSGFIHPTQDRIWWGRSSGVFWKELKDRAATDHKDPTDQGGGQYIISTVRFNPISMGTPDQEKLCDSGALLFRQYVPEEDTPNSWTTLALHIGSDQYPTEQSQTVLQADYSVSSSIPFWMPQGGQRGTRFMFRLIHLVAGERFVLEGLQLNFRVNAPRGGNR
jgi:hypothetical protein